MQFSNLFVPVEFGGSEIFVAVSMQGMVFSILKCGSGHVKPGKHRHAEIH